VSVAMKAYNKYQIYGILRDYRMMVNQIMLLNHELNRTDFKGVAQYGTESTLPTGQGIVSKALESEVIRRSEKSERMIDYANKVQFINQNRHKITDEREKVVLDCLLDGMTLNAIARHLGSYRNQISKIQDSIVDKIVE
jgi:DNA-binding NarL/FixJ family response regulator